METLTIISLGCLQKDQLRFKIFVEYLLNICYICSDAVLITLVLAQSILAATVNIITKRAINMTTAILFSLALSMQVMFLLIAQYTVLKHIQPGEYIMKKFHISFINRLRRFLWNIPIYSPPTM